MEVILRRVSIFLGAAFLAASFALSDLAANASAANPKVVELPKEAVSKMVLENGLVILAKESLPKDLVAVNVRVKAGSSLEEEYLGSGISHLVEHMLFKGTRTRGPGEIEREIKSYGGFINGSVGQDLTEYSVIVPAEYAPKVISLLKDMLLNASFSQAEFDKEKEVILKELRLDNDEPQNLLVRLLNETAYLRHTYKYPPIGYEEKFRNLKRDDAVKYYNRMYAPNRIVLAIAGGSGGSDLLSIAEKEFKDFRSPNYDVIGLSPAEPVQIESRDAVKKTGANLAYLAVGYHSTGILDEDLFAMDILSMILGRGDNSRLNTSLLKKERLVHAISCWNFTPRDPGLFVVTAVMDADKLPAAEEAIGREIATVKSGAFSADELEGAKRMALGDFIFSMQTVDYQASDMASNYLLTGSYDFARRYVAGIQAISAEDLKRVANKYLRDDGATVVKVVPQNFNTSTGPGSVSVAEAPMKSFKLPNGIRIAIRQDTRTPTVAIPAVMGGGLATETVADNGISNLVARRLVRGTAARSEDQITGVIEKLGGSISPFSGFNGFGINMEFLKPDIDTALSVLQDILVNSAFPPDQLETERALVLAMIRQENDDIFERGINAFRKELFGPSPYGFPYLGEEAGVRELKRGELLDYYKRYVVPGNIVLSVSGDVDEQNLSEKLTKAFSGLKAQEPPVSNFKQAMPDKIAVKTISMEKEQSLVLLGFMTTSIKDPDRYALDVLGSVLSGYSGRLFDSLRNKLSLAYTLGCVQKSMVDTGFFTFYVATAKSKIASARKGLLKEIDDIRKNGISDEELLLAKRELIAGHKIKMQTNSYFTQTSAVAEMYGLGYDDIFKYADMIGKVTGQDVKRAAEKYFDLDRYCAIIISGNE